MVVLRRRLIPAKHVTCVHPSKNCPNALCAKEEDLAVVSLVRPNGGEVPEFLELKGLTGLQEIGLLPTAIL